ncbi:MAG: hypothetical protein P4L50_24680 [Anaerolineaceae bacterium]|nr:hypothetical protein [Anaerolineaceae bacterium]
MSNQPGQTTQNPKPDNQATKLVNLLISTIKLFQDHTGVTYADIPVNGHYETIPIRTHAFREWMAEGYFRRYHGAIGGSALESALTVLCGKAGKEPKRDIFLRVGHYQGNTYLDLCNDNWSVVEITASGWSIINRSPIPFRRAKGMKSLPDPIPGGNVDDLLNFINVTDPDDFHLIVSYILAVFTKGPFPVLSLGGEQGAAKTTASLVCRRLIDPNEADLKTKPRDEKDLMIAANNSYILTFDNLSGLPDWLSDSFCRLATGGGFSTRALYTDNEETIFNAKRPLILNGISEFLTRPDLVSRAIHINLPAIPEYTRKPEAQFWAEFYQAQPSLLGAFLDVAAIALTNLPNVNLTTMPRMADFAKWMVAAEPGLCWPAGTFEAAYKKNQESSNYLVLEDSHLAAEIRSLVEKGDWEGTTRELWDKLVSRTYGTPQYDYFLKQKPHQLSSELRRLAPSLRAQEDGIEIVFYPPKRTSRKENHFVEKVERLITLQKIVKINQPSMVTP